MNFHLDPALIALLQVILIDITLAGDNAVVIGTVAARVPPADQRKVIFWGLAAAVVLRIGLATIAVKLLAILGLAIAGGILLLWVAWRLYRDLREGKEEKAGMKAIAHAESKLGDSHLGHAHGSQAARRAALKAAIVSVMVADLSMSLDNVLAVAGAARDHIWVLVVGLLLSIALTGVAATYIAKLLHRFPWVTYAGLAIVVYVALNMIWHGWAQVSHLL